MSRPFSPRRLLLPLVPAYRLALLLRELRLCSGLEPVRRLKWPVISIGNLSTGGSGKTPLTIALAKAFARRGYAVDVLSRGYGRRSKLAARVRPKGTAEEFGDEPLLIAHETGLPVYVAGQRYHAGLLAESDGPADTSRAVHLLDDGFQHRQLYRNVNILLLDQRDWREGMHLAGLLPAGNLREPLRAARRASVIAIPAGEPDLEAALRAWGWPGPVWRVRRAMQLPAVSGPVVAFCGIARQEQFFDGLEAGGLKLLARIAFADHHRYTEADLKRVTAAARAAGATAVVTTEKDQVRLGQLAQALPESLPLVTARLSIEIENEEEAIGWLVGRFAFEASVFGSRFE
jgi:tetraacyldisaccharide 4'-kinase